MSTDQSYTRLYNKKLLPTDAMKEKLLEYLLAASRDVHQDVYPYDGVFTVIPVTAVGNNMINIANAAPGRGVTGTGKTVKLGTADARFSNVNIPPSAAQTFHVGIEQNDVEVGIETNPRTGEFEYSYFSELPGKLANPTSVTNNGDGTLTIILSTVLDAGHDHSGRQVRVWLKSRTNGGPGPLSASAAVAIETRTVTYAAGTNRIVTTGVFGQTTISTTASDYMVQVIGPTVTTVDISASSGVLYLGTVVGVAAANPIVTIDTSGQTILSQASGQTYGGGPNWADGTTNPGTSVEAQLDKIISDLAGSTGSGKVKAAAATYTFGAAPAETLTARLDRLDTNKANIGRSHTLSISGNALALTFNVNNADGAGYTVQDVGVSFATSTNPKSGSYSPQLPVGATVTAVRFYVHDNAAQAITWNVWHTGPYTAGSNLGTVSSSGAATDQTLTISGLTAVITSGTRLNLRFSIPAAGAGQIFGIEVDYTY